MEHASTAQYEPLRQAVRHYITEEVLPLERDNGISWDVAPPKDIRRQVRLRARELGLYAPDMPEAVGGGGPGGRLVMLNMSKRDDASTTGRERLYRLLPGTVALNLLGGCRPVLAEKWVAAAGFGEVECHFLDGKLASEVVAGRK